MRELHFTALRDLLRQRTLQALFPFAVTWLLILVFIRQIEHLPQVNPFPESGLPHRLFEETAQPLAALLILATAAWLQFRLLRRRPGFLRLPASAPLLFTALRFIIHGAVLFVAITVIVVLISYLFYDPATDPQGQFHIWVWAGGVLDAIAFTPAAAILSVWMRMWRQGADGAVVERGYGDARQVRRNPHSPAKR